MVHGRMPGLQSRGGSALVTVTKYVSVCPCLCLRSGRTVQEGACMCNCLDSGRTMRGCVPGLQAHSMWGWALRGDAQCVGVDLGV